MSKKPTSRKPMIMRPVAPKGGSLSDRINYHLAGATIRSGRGHGRVTSHGRERLGGLHGRKKVKKGGKMKEGMTAFIRDLVLMWRSANIDFNAEYHIDHGNSYELANVIARNMQFFDCSIIFDYVFQNLDEMYPDTDVPPSTDAVLPADNVGLYVNSEIPAEKEMFFYCIPVFGGKDSEDAIYYRRHYNVYSVTHFDRGEEIISPDLVVIPHHVGQICVALNDDCIFDYSTDYLNLNDEDRGVIERSLRIVCGMLQTINTPRLVVPTRQKVHQFHKEKLKKSLGNFIPDAWNMVEWNVDEPVKSKEHEEGTGARLPLHFRRGYPRKAEEHWKGAYWSTIRNRYEQYIHGYEAGHPAFGVKKNYHLPRKDVA